MLTKLQKASLRELDELIIEMGERKQVNTFRELKQLFEERLKHFGDFDTYASYFGDESPDESAGSGH